MKSTNGSNSIRKAGAIRSSFLQVFFRAIILCGLFSTQATAASFDCQKAASKVEKIVCSDAELSKLDEEMAKVYHDAMTNLSPEGQKETRQYQKYWLKIISSYTNPDSGIKETYKERIKQLQCSLIKFPDRIFRNVYAHYSRNDLTYPQIENPRDENEKFWNNFISKYATGHSKYSRGCINRNNEYTVSFSNKHLISVRRLDSMISEGAASPYRTDAEAESISWLLESKRELQAADLFGDKTDWQSKVAALVSQKLQDEKIAQYLKREYPYNKISTWEIMHKVTSPSEWVILKDGLGFGFFEVYMKGFNVFITIDWKTLDPYLSKNGRSLIHD